MLGVISIGTYLPPARQDNLALAPAFGFAESALRSKIGILAAARKSPDQETSDLCVEAFRDLKGRCSFDTDAIDLIVVVTQNPDGKGLPHTSAIVHSKLGLPKSCFAFDVSLGCSGYVAGLAIVKGYLEATGKKLAVLITADPYSKVLNNEDRNTALIFGDGATATLIGETKSWTIGAFDLGTDGSKFKALEVREDGKLNMNGRSVFDFCALNVPGSVERTLDINGLTKPQIDRWLLHPGSRYIVDVISKRLELGHMDFPAESYGNTVSSSIPLMLAELSPVEAPTVLLSGFGVGLGYATTILKGVS